MNELDYAERTLHGEVDAMRASALVSEDDAAHFHERIDLLLAELRACRDRPQQ